MSPHRDAFLRAAVSLMLRDYREDASRLNSLFGLSGKTELAPMPPNPFMGDPGEDCILMLGINPAYRAEDDAFRRGDVDLPLSCLSEFERTGDTRSLGPWLDKLRTFFVGEYWYGGYFSWLGRILGEGVFADTWARTGQDRRQIMHRHVIKMDAVPWYSRKAGFSSATLRVGFREDPGLMANMALLEAAVDRYRPRWIQVNGMGPWGAIRDTLVDSGSYEVHSHGPDARTDFGIGFATLANRKVPVLMHKFVSSRGGPGHHGDWDWIWPYWFDWLGGSGRFH